MLRPDKRRPGGAIPRRRAAMLCRSSPHEITERHRDVPMLADGFRSWGRCSQSIMTLTSGAPVSLSLHRAAAQRLNSLRRCPQCQRPSPLGPPPSDLGGLCRQSRSRRMPFRGPRLGSVHGFQVWANNAISFMGLIAWEHRMPP